MVARRGLRRMKLDRTEMSTTGWTTLTEKKTAEVTELLEFEPVSLD